MTMTKIEVAEQHANNFGFFHAFKAVRDSNPSNNLPYHNWFHTCCMVANCIDGAFYYGLSTKECHLLGVAALFHDYNHSGGTEPDAINIFRAQTAFYKFADEVNLYSPLDKFQIAKTIEVTQFPFIYTPLTPEQTIIRDADLMQILEPEWFEHVILGLQAEFKAGGRELTVKEMLDGQVQFLSDHIPQGLFTKWGIEKFDTDIYAERLEKINYKRWYLV